ncbi:MAG: fumarylacetoacetate hydrolase family protein [Candidatus Aminicenantes bacterium]|nr:fumarylacetoacetate hydrolase family protein [Candidatus Aminicenantes bacterium]
MKIYRFEHERSILYGVLKEDLLHPLSGSIFGTFRVEKRGVPISRVRLLPPVKPGKIICIGRNYREHSREMGNPVPEEPLIFLKPPSAIIGPGETILSPAVSQRVDYEGELAVVIKRAARRLAQHEDIGEFVLGYTCFNDVTARDLQVKDVQFTRAKSFDTFAPVGPCIAAAVDPSRLRIKTFLNGKLRQSASTRNMIFPVPYLVRYISHVMTLCPGDIISTGTPEGVGPMSPGDRVDVQIEGIGTLSNTVSKDESEMEPRGDKTRLKPEKRRRT